MESDGKQNKQGRFPEDLKSIIASLYSMPHLDTFGFNKPSQ